MDRAEVLERIEPLVGLGVRTVTHTPHTKVVLGGGEAGFRSSRGGHLQTISDEGLHNLLSFIRFPEPMENKLLPATASQVATELLNKKDTYDVITRDGEIVSFAKPGSHRNTPAERVLSSVEKAVKGDVDYQRALILPNLVGQIELATERRVPDPGIAKQYLQAGAMIQFSPIGAVNPQVQSYILRQWCTNGAVSTDVLRSYNYGGGGGNDGDNIWQWFRRSVQDAVNSASAIHDRWAKMVKENIPKGERAAVLEAMIKEAGLPDDIAAAVRARAVEEPIRNTYDVMNHITYASTHLLEEPRQIVRAQNAVAAFQNREQHSRLCPYCRSNMRHN